MTVLNWPTSKFWRSANLILSLKLTYDRPPVAMVTKIWLLEHKIGYNSACIGDTSQILVPSWET